MNAARELYAAVEISQRPGVRLIEEVRLHPTSERAAWDAEGAADQHKVVSVHKVALPQESVDYPARMDRWLREHGGKIRLLARVADTVEQSVMKDRLTTARHDLLTQFHALFANMPQLYRAFHEWPETPEAEARAAQRLPF